MISGIPVAFRVACWSENGMKDCKGCLLLDALHMEVQVAEMAVIAITKYISPITMGCVGLYSMANSLQSTC